MFKESLLGAFFGLRISRRSIQIESQQNRLVIDTGHGGRPICVALERVIGLELKSVWWRRPFGVWGLQLRVMTDDGKTRRIEFLGKANLLEGSQGRIATVVRVRLLRLVESVHSFISDFDAELLKVLDSSRYARGSVFGRFISSQEQLKQLHHKQVRALTQHPWRSEISGCESALDEFKRVEGVLAEGDKVRKTHNEQVVHSQMQLEANYFNSIDASPLNKEQVVAALTFDDANLTIAAAGSGKTSVIVAKAGFAMKTGLFSAKEILILAFNRKAAEEIRERLAKLPDGKTVPARTFHSLGFRLWLQRNGRRQGFQRPRLIDFGKPSGRSLLFSVIKKLIEKSPEFSKRLAEWCSQYRYPDPGVFLGNSSDLDAEELQHRYEELCKRISRSRREGAKAFEAQIPTLSVGHYVRSFEEARIFNWLYLRGVEFEYERAAPRFLTESMNDGLPPERQVKVYRPDFTYKNPAIEKRFIFHEHFGLNAQGEAPSFLGGKKYVARAQHKRNAFARTFRAVPNQPSQFFETRSADFRDGSLFTKLHDELTSRGLLCGEERDDLRLVALGALVGDSKLLDGVISPFIEKFRDSALSFEDLRGEAKVAGHDKERTLLFLSLMEQINDELSRTMENPGEGMRPYIDFALMISEATRYLEESDETVSDAKLILVDEFQDIARSRAKLVQALLDQHPDDSILYCVGDDWQAINRFAGSDLAIFRHMAGRQESMGFPTPLKARSTHVTELGVTYRCAQGIANVAKAFVMARGEQVQINKSVRASFTLEGPVIRVVEHEDTASARVTALYDALDRLAGLPKLVDQEGQERVAKVFVLTRNRKKMSLPEGIDPELLSVGLAKRYQSRGLHIDWQTLHTSKGLGADYVVLVGLDAGSKGYPKDHFTDPLIELLLPSLADPWDEERRLFYVGLTRAKREVTLICAGTQPSIFVHELLEMKEPESSWIHYFPLAESERTLCPACKRSWLRRFEATKTRSKSYVRCIRYPYCGYVGPVSNVGAN